MRQVLCVVALLLLTPLFAGARETINTLSVDVLGNTRTYSLSDLTGMPFEVVKVTEGGGTVKYAGPSLANILAASNIPIGALKGEHMKFYVSAIGDDDFSAVLSLAEIDPTFTKIKVIVAVQKNGAPISADEGPVRLILKDQGKKARRIKNLTTLKVLSSSETPYRTVCPKNFPSFNPNFPPPVGADDVFKLSQAYPDTFFPESYPWKAIDPFSQPEAYLRAVLDYSLEGNLEVDFKGQANKVRKWYHAPWLHDDSRSRDPRSPRPGNGREYINGLTRERGAPEFEIHRSQDVALENWAVGMYNAPGGYTLGKIWCTESGIPDPKAANFPEGTVSFKLLFTDGTVDKVPFLKNTLEWTANIYECDPRVERCRQRKNRTVRLLQIDIAVKDDRAAKTGWFFGTYMYDAKQPEDTVWGRMVPVGLSWGDDSTVTSLIDKDGAFINQDLKETWLNNYLVEKPDQDYPPLQAYVRYHGLGGRLNGPVDNPISSCISCHGQAAVADNGFTMPMANFGLTRANFPIDEFNKYFADVNPGAYPRDFGGRVYINTDYSLQVSAGIRNYHTSVLLDAATNDESNGAQLMTSPQLHSEVRKSTNGVDVFQLPEQVTRGE